MPFRHIIIAAFCLILLWGSPAVQADEVEWVVFKLNKSSASASSVLVEKKRPASYYGARKATDNNQGTAWCEGKTGPGIGESIEVKFKPAFAHAIQVLHGFAKHRRLYQANNRIKDYHAEIQIKSGKTIKLSGSFKDEACGYIDERETEECWLKKEKAKKAGKTSKQVDQLYKKCMVKFDNMCGRWGDTYNAQSGEGIMLAKPECVVGAKITIKSVYPGKKHDDTCITEIGIYGRMQGIPLSKEEETQMKACGS